MNNLHYFNNIESTILKLFDAIIQSHKEEFSKEREQFKKFDLLIKAMILITLNDAHISLYEKMNGSLENLSFLKEERARVEMLLWWIGPLDEDEILDINKDRSDVAKFAKHVFGKKILLSAVLQGTH